MNLVPLMVTIGLKSDGSANYPPFNKIPSSIRGGADWCKYVDRFGGWIYDKAGGHQKHDDESPRGQHRGMLLVPEDFANMAEDHFPDTCEVMEDADAGDFYHRRVVHDQPEIMEDLEALQIIAAKRGAGLPEDDMDRNALDLDHPSAGRRRNKLKQWDGYLADKGLEIDSSAVARVKARRATREERRAERRQRG